MKTSSSERFRIAPQIPDHEMLRLIGKGSYGEVWLARSVTGALRAVKVVQRSDFQYDRTFEREFEGIKKFEPISRSHPGLVDVLHVGRNLNEGFYYCVMELGDDQTRGANIVPELYVARTLSSDIKSRENGRLKVDECVEAGVNLAGGLHYLHQHGLTHRDVKPSNVIFVEGVAKLADIGLVAASGQRTFVGTEGFVPPEGPGSPAADIYSLGMVLYEVSTGNDRLEFPELPRRLPPESERPKWRALNAVVCKACAQKAKDRHADAAEFAQALSRIKAGRVRRKTFRGRLFRTMVWSGLLASMVMLGRNLDFLTAVRESEVVIASMGEAGRSGIVGSGEPVGEVIPPVEEPLVEPVVEPVVKLTGDVKIVSEPGVQVWTLDGGYIDEIDESGVKILENVKIGPVVYVLKKDGFAPKRIEGVLTAAMPLGMEGRLEVFRPPLEGETWVNSFGMEFSWVDGRHVARKSVTLEMFEEFRKATGSEAAFYRAKVLFPDPALVGEQSGVMVTRDGANQFCDWLTRISREAGYLTAQHEYVLNEFADSEIVAAEESTEDEELFLLMCAVEQSAFALATFATVPAGVGIFQDGVLLGAGGETLRLKPGVQLVTFQLTGYTTVELELDLQAGDELEREIELEKSRAAVLGTEWTNDLGMKFVPLDGEVLFGAYEVRVRDFRAFTEATGKAWTYTPLFPQGEDHPVVQVTREDAGSFCEWLTSTDLKNGLLEKGYEYRLPRDLEWSRAAGLAVESGLSPAARDGQEKGVFPWGREWPPPAGVANLGSKLVGYSDEFPNTAPVGSFQANPLGIYDLSGNVWEWVEEFYGGSGNLKGHGVVRGGCFSDSREVNLLVSCRTPVRLGFAGVLNGFRVVVAKSGDREGNSNE